MHRFLYASIVYVSVHNTKQRHTGKHVTHARYKHTHSLTFSHTYKWELNIFFLFILFCRRRCCCFFIHYDTIWYVTYIWHIPHSSQVHKQEVEEENESKRKNNCRLLYRKKNKEEGKKNFIYTHEMWDKNVEWKKRRNYRRKRTGKRNTV